MSFNFESAIEDFWAAHRSGAFVPEAYAGRLSLDDAYRIQLALIDRRVAAGERQIGWKVGLTAKPIQEQVGFYEPVFGCILEMQPSGHVFGATELIRPGFETELCIRLGGGFDRPATFAEVRDDIVAIYPALEIIETRVDVSEIPLVLADNAQQRSIICGDAVSLGNLALESVEANVTLNGQQIAAGYGAAVLGNPIESIVWLTGKLGAFGRRLRPSDIVMTGSFVRQFPLAPGDTVRAVFSGVGEVEVSVSPS